MAFRLKTSLRLADFLEIIPLKKYSRKMNLKGTFLYSSQFFQNLNILTDYNVKQIIRHV